MGRKDSPLVETTFDEMFLRKGEYHDDYVADFLGRSEELVELADTTLGDIQNLLKGRRAELVLAASCFHFLGSTSNVPGEPEPALAPTQAHMEFLQLLCATGHISLRKDHSIVDDWLTTLSEGSVLLDLTIRAWTSFGFASSFVRSHNNKDTSIDKDSILTYSSFDALVKRNFSWPSQMEEIYTSLFTILENRKTSVKPLALYRFLGGIVALVENRIRQHISSLRSMYNNYHMAKGRLGLKLDLPDWFVKQDQDEFRRFSESFVVSLEDLDQIAVDVGLDDSPHAIMELLSLSPGEFSHSSLSHLVSQNPVCQQPFLRLAEDSWLCLTPGTIHSFRHDQVALVLKSRGDGPALSRARTDYLEQTAQKMLQKAFHPQRFFPNFVVKDSISKETKGEADLIIPDGPILILVECKSAEVRPEAMRGAEDRVKKWITEQAVRGTSQIDKMRELVFGYPENNLQELRGIWESLSDNRMILSLDIVLCLEPPSFLDSRSKTLIRGGLVDEPIKPVVSIFELQAAIELLVKPYQFVHFLWKRSLWEKDTEISGDGFDLLGLYLNRPSNIEDDPIHLYMTSLEVDRELNLPPSKRSTNLPAFPLEHFGVNVIEPLWNAGEKLLTLLLLDLEREKQAEVLKFYKKVSKKKAAYFRRSKGVEREWHVGEGVRLIIGFLAKMPAVPDNGCIVVLDPSLGFVPRVLGADRIKVDGLRIHAGTR